MKVLDVFTKTIPVCPLLKQRIVQHWMPKKSHLFINRNYHHRNHKINPIKVNLPIAASVVYLL